MKRIIAAAALTLFTAGIAMAADTITLPAKNGNVTFPHKKHESSTAARSATPPRRAARSRGSARTGRTRPAKGATRR